MSAEYPAEIECPECGGTGCDECSDGWFTVTECPTQYIGQELIQDIRIVGSPDNFLPVAGGLLDQSAWWFELRGQLKLEEHRIVEEQNKRRDP